MLNTHRGKIIAIIIGGKNDGKFVYIDEEYKDGAEEIILGEKSKIVPLMKLKDEEERGVYYVAGPSGSGKSHYSARLAENFMKANPDCHIFFFSRTDHKGDKSLKDLKLTQINLDEKILDDKIDIEKDIPPKSILFFDDCNTIRNKKIKKYVQHLIEDAMECGRKPKINIILTNHLIIPQEKEFARTVMNEIQTLTIFPKSGTSQQITYVLKTYFGLTTRQIKEILALDSRWVTVLKSYPMTVLHEKGIYIL